jgi:hypothetical protein
MSSIVEFLQARIAEDLEVAVRAHEAGDRGDVHPLGVTTVGLSEDPGIFITPQRLTDECKAKRAIIETLRHLEDQHEWAFFDPCVEGAIPKILAALAQPYSGHRDFDASWNA